MENVVMGFYYKLCWSIYKSQKKNIAAVSQAIANACFVDYIVLGHALISKIDWLNRKTFFL